MREARRIGVDQRGIEQELDQDVTDEARAIIFVFRKCVATDGGYGQVT